MKISKEKFLEMANWGNAAELSILKEEFPDAFKPKLENGKYYKSNFILMGGEKSKFFVFIVDFDNQLNYGFDYSGKWCKNMFFTNQNNSLAEASTQEWLDVFYEIENKN
jgi:hypothetical protein